VTSIIFALFSLFLVSPAYSVTLQKKVIDVFDELISFRHPDSWTPAVEREKDKIYSLEYLQKKEFSAQRWTELFTIVALENAISKNVSAQDAIKSIDTAVKEQCPNDFYYKTIGASEHRGKKQFEALIGCKKIPSTLASGLEKGDVDSGYYLAIEGEKSIYVFHKSKRSLKYRPEELITLSNYKEFIKDFSPMKVCSQGSTKLRCR